MLPKPQIRQDLKFRALFGDDDFDDEEDLEDEWSQEDRPVNPDDFSRREVNARLLQYANWDRDWLFSY